MPWDPRPSKAARIDFIQFGHRLKLVDTHTLGPHQLRSGPPQLPAPLARLAVASNFPFGWGVNTENAYGETPLQVALREGDMKLFNKLVAKDADLDVLTDTGQTLFEFAHSLRRPLLCPWDPTPPAPPRGPLQRLADALSFSFGSAAKAAESEAESEASPPSLPVPPSNWNQPKLRETAQQLAGEQRAGRFQVYGSSLTAPPPPA